jgi:hypothetical protein
VNVAPGTARRTTGKTCSTKCTTASSFGSQSIEPVKTRSCGSRGAVPLGRKNAVSTPVGTADTLSTPYPAAIVSRSLSETATTWSKRRHSAPS